MSSESAKHVTESLGSGRGGRDAGCPSHVLLTGASGLVGRALAAHLTQQGCRVDRLVRREPDSGGGEIGWDVARGEIDAGALEDADAAVHLAGESIAAGRWTAARKGAIRESRQRGTDLLSRTLAGLTHRPRVLVSASAIGFYGDRGDQPLGEEAAPGTGFLSDVCREWEAATKPAADAGIRVVNLRIGVVLSPDGGALAKMLTPFKLGAGGRLGHGRQYMSWIALADLVRVIHHAMTDESLSGPVNAVAPEPVTNVAFTKTLGRVLHRPTIAPMPGFMVRLMFGEMGQALLLEGARIEPRKLLAAGFAFSHPDLESALRHELGRPRDAQ